MKTERKSKRTSIGFSDCPTHDDINRITDRLPAPITVTSRVENLGLLIADKAPDAIERQEAQGQQELVNSEQLPVKCSPVLKAKLQYAGVVFDSVTPDDALFCLAILPKGWKKQPTDHSMWSALVDDKGQKQAMIFYKAAFYDRDAFMSGLRRDTLLRHRTSMSRRASHE